MLRSIVSVLLLSAGLAAGQVAPADPAAPAAPANPAVPPAPADPAVPPAPADPAAPAAPSGPSKPAIPAGSTVFTDLVGTWSSKSNSTLTGPKFYDPVNEVFKEPAHTGISYSFTADGHFEEAYYRAVANPQNPKCPKGIIQWQHGSFTKETNGSLILKPIAVDGRQLYSDPCTYEHSIYTRYNTSEVFERYEVLTDGYRQIPRLNLYKHDGSPMMPLYLALSPPEMLPTTTLNPLTTATPSGKGSDKVKREEMPLNYNVINKRAVGQQNADRWWWFGVVLTASGAALYYFF